MLAVIATRIVWYGLVAAAIALPIIFLVVIPIVTLVLAAITTLRSRHRFSSSASPAFRTALYKGRVSHTRYRPAAHSFSYPLFFCVLDLDEASELFGDGAACRSSGQSASVSASAPQRPALWPLSLLMQFREMDHLKNGEGCFDTKSNNAADRNNIADNSIRTRICRLVQEKTKGKCNPSAEQRIILVTHLAYYGYCFNPVSFYYVLKSKQGSSGSGGSRSEEVEEIDAIVAEVSNTPWNEMQCYVLHPDSIDVNVVKAGRSRSADKGGAISKFPLATEDEIIGDDNQECANPWRSINYIFSKAFHVSPFMTMDHIYDWTFWMPRNDRIAVSTSMIKGGKVPYFNAYFDIRRQPFTPFRLFYQLIQMPVYCAIIQVWIHIEAFWLFLKGVEFIPHPQGSETAASLMIAKLMTPFFRVKDWLNRGTSTKSD
jgi:DUF1365 family protein